MRFCETGSTPGVPLDFKVAVCGLFHFGVIKLGDIMGKLGDLVPWVHKLCITTEYVLCLSPHFKRCPARPLYSWE